MRSISVREGHVLDTVVNGHDLASLGGQKRGSDQKSLLVLGLKRGDPAGRFWEGLSEVCESALISTSKVGASRRRTGARKMAA